MFFLTLQYPLVDARRFVEREMLLAPDWPQPANGEFVRCFGAARSRRGFPGWIPEPRFVDGHRALRFPKQFELAGPGAPHGARMRVVGQRLFFDGFGGGKYEIVMKGTVPAPAGRLGLAAVVDALAAAAVEVRMASRRPQEYVKTTLGKLGPALVKTLLLATTGRDQALADKTLLLVGDPLVLLETGERSPMALRAGEAFAVPTAADRRIQVRHATLPWSQGEVRVWHLAGHPGDREVTRRIRVTLLRLHAGRWALQTVQRLVAQDRIRVQPRSRGSDRLQRFLTHSADSVLDLKSLAAADPATLDAPDLTTVEIARRLDALSTPGSLELLLDKLEAEIDVRPTVARKLAATSPSEVPTPRPPRRFRIAFSFPGEHRAYFAALAEALAGKLGKETVLYDQYHGEELLRPNLDVHLPKLYLEESEVVVVGFCKEYTQKPWTGLEWRQIRQHIQRREDWRLMLLRLDDIAMESVEGLTAGDGFFDCRERKAEELLKLIEQRLARLGVMPRGSR